MDIAIRIYLNKAIFLIRKKSLFNKKPSAINTVNLVAKEISFCNYNSNILNFDDNALKTEEYYCINEKYWLNSS